MFAAGPFSGFSFSDFFSTAGQIIVYLPYKGRTKVTSNEADSITSVIENRLEIDSNYLSKYKLRTYVQPKD